MRKSLEARVRPSDVSAANTKTNAKRAKSSVSTKVEPQQRSTGTIIQLISDDGASPPDMKLRVHPHTTIEKIVRGYKRKMSVDMDRQVHLVFNGDKLEEEHTVADVGFQESDAVDVRAAYWSVTPEDGWVVE